MYLFVCRCWDGCSCTTAPCGGQRTNYRSQSSFQALDPLDWGSGPQSRWQIQWAITVSPAISFNCWGFSNLPENLTLQSSMSSLPLPLSFPSLLLFPIQLEPSFTLFPASHLPRLIQPPSCHSKRLSLNRELLFTKFSVNEPPRSSHNLGSTAISRPSWCSLTYFHEFTLDLASISKRF